jgi:meiotic recombination protein SPO11
VIEKEAAFLRLAEDRFYNKYALHNHPLTSLLPHLIEPIISHRCVPRFPCIVITGKGQPDVATRLFLKKLKAELKIPILGLFDSDPWGEQEDPHGGSEAEKKGEHDGGDG